MVRWYSNWDVGIIRSSLMLPDDILWISVILSTMVFVLSGRLHGSIYVASQVFLERYGDLSNLQAGVCISSVHYRLA